MKWLRRITVFAASLYLVVLAGLIFFVEIYAVPEDLAQQPSIVVLGAGQRPDGSMGRSTAERLWAGVALYHRIGASRFVVTGGQLVDEPRPVADAMAASARMAGVPEEIIVIEPRALSTLQNALLAGDMLGDARRRPVVLVTHRFHLPRSWASFRWAGFDQLQLYPADSASAHWLRFGFGVLFVEAGKTFLNAGRAGMASLMDLVGIDQQTYLPFLD